MMRQGVTSLVPFVRSATSRRRACQLFSTSTTTSLDDKQDPEAVDPPRAWEPFSRPFLPLAVAAGLTFIGLDLEKQVMGFTMGQICWGSAILTSSVLRALQGAALSMHQQALDQALMRDSAARLRRHHGRHHRRNVSQ
ncbi:hypothetical protein WJX72_005313 [[Myrmecia] bisecta]|uniref:Uncharacterized protein n=1 Tax=[Myrmecia] bisecta TaxID=41462 RepID=A0AAW1NZ03_9CHLO